MTDWIFIFTIPWCAILSTCITDKCKIVCHCGRKHHALPLCGFIHIEENNEELLEQQTWEEDKCKLSDNNWVWISDQGLPDSTQSKRKTNFNIAIYRMKFCPCVMNLFIHVFRNDWDVRGVHDDYSHQQLWLLRRIETCLCSRHHLKWLL